MGGHSQEPRKIPPNLRLLVGILLAGSKLQGQVARIALHKLGMF